MIMMLRASDIARERRAEASPDHCEKWTRLPGFGRSRLKKLVRVRVGRLNVGSMTGRGRELGDLMERRKMGVLCVQETRWKGNKARRLGGDCKLFYSDEYERGRNGVGIQIT